MGAPSKYAVAADVVAIARFADGPRVLLVARRNPPLGWAIPGGFVEPDEDLPDAARRELMEETGVAAGELTLVGAFGQPDRDPRGRTISIAFLAELDGPAPSFAGDDAAQARWFPLDALPERLAFDHAQIVARALEMRRPR